MSWLAQVAHVMAKDVVESRRLLVFYLALVAVATGRALGWSVLSHPVFGGMMILVVLAGLFLVAVVVQADSPTRSDAFWATQPLQPSAVVGAKVGYALLLLVIGLVGQAIAVWSFDVQGLALLSLVARAIPMHGGLLLGAMVVAALVRDLRSFTLAIVLIPAVLLVLTFFGTTMGAVSVSSPSAGPPPGDGAPTLMIARLMVALAGIALLAWLYRTRDARVHTRLAGFLLTVLILVTSMSDSPEPIDEDPAALTAMPLTLERLYGGLQPNDGELRLNVLAADVPETLHLVLAQSELVVRLRDGTEMRLPTRDPFAEMSTMDNTPLPRLEGIRWRGSRPIRAPLRTIEAPLTPEQQRAVRAGIAHVTLVGRVFVLEARPITTMPLSIGSSETADGRRIHIEAWTHELDEASIMVGVRSVGDTRVHPASSGLARLGLNIQAAIVNPGRGEGIPLGFAEGTGGTGSLVLPGTPHRSATLGFTAERGRMVPPPPEARDEPPLDDAWFQGAHLLLTTSVVRGSFPVRLELEVP